jgi:uncharacterized membrane protein YkoI
MWARSILLAAALAATALSGPAYAGDLGRGDDGPRHHSDRGHNNNGDRRQAFYGGRGLPGQDQQRGRSGGAWFQDRGQDSRNGGDDGDHGRRNIRSLREIADMMRSRFGGDLISARLENGPRPFYVLRWRMPNGDVRDFQVDAESGQVR